MRDGEAYLSDAKAYRRCNKNKTGEIANRVKQFVKEIYSVGYIDKFEIEFLMPPDPVRTQFMYFPYKIHKNPIAVRPVVSGINGTTTQVSKYLDHFYKQLIPKVKSYLKNSLETLDRMVIPEIERDVLLVSMDVKSMYTMIPQEGINSLLTKSGLPKHILREMLNKNNTFSFNEVTYRRCNEINLLDLTVDKPDSFIVRQKLATRTHIKPTNTFQYIHFTSHHPFAVKKSVLYSEILRYKKQCSEDNEFKKIKRYIY